ncbi:MAG: DUF1573 domain-containing protein [Planctomycetota bacterium]
MRKVCLVTVFLLASASPAMAQNWANKIFGGNPNVPVLQDFGLVARGAQLQAKLPMTNIYKVPLTVTDVRVSCGCVEAKAIPTTLQPNETGYLSIKMDGTRFTGPKSVNVFITFGPQFVSTANIVVSANARQDIVLNPGEIDFGAVLRGSSSERSLEVECAGKPNWKVVQVTKSATTPFELKSEVLPPRVNNGASVIGYRIIASLKADAPLGSFREAVDLITNDPTQQKVTFVVSGAVTPPVTVAPNPVQVTGLKIGNAFNTKVVVTSSQPFRIIGVKGNGDDVNLTAPDRSAITHVLDLNVTPRTPGLLSREIVLQTDMRNESVKVIIQGNVTP